MADKKREIRKIEIEPAKNGGHTVTHHMKERPQHSAKHGMMPSAYEEPESHVFGEHDGHEMLAHVANALAIKEGEFSHDEDERKGDEEE